MKNKPTFGLGLLPFSHYSGRPTGRMQFDKLLSLAEQADHAGYDSIWTSDSIARSIPRFDTFLYLTAIAMRTKQVKLGTCVAVAPLRHPVMMTRILSTLDCFSGGRVLLGAGAGWIEPEFQNLDIPFHERGGRTTEALRLIRRLWTEDDVTHDGKYYHIKQVTIDPKPVQKPHPPILVGGNSDAAWKRAAEIGDGWVTLSYITPADITHGVGRIKEFAEKNGRRFEPYVVGELNINVGPNRREAEEEARAWHVTFLRGGKSEIMGGSSTDQLAATGALGEPRVIADKAQEMIDAGAHCIMFRFLAFDLQTQFDRLTDQVLPLLQ